MAHEVLVTPGVRPLTLPGRLGAVRRMFEHDALTIVVVAAWTALLAVAIPALFVTDSWLAFADGRLVAQRGLPYTDTLTFWSAGTRWIDQQWGAQLLLYEVARGGLRLAAAVGVTVVVATLSLIAVAARRLGGSARSTAVAVALPLLAAPWLAQLRTQTLALPLFVSVFWLLARDARLRDRRVLLVTPLLVVWANLHGSVSLAAALAALYGLTIVSTRRLEGAVLMASPFALLASPYGFDLVGYYRLMLLHPPLASVVNEWQPMKVGGASVVFFATAFLFVALLARHRAVLTSFEQWALLPLLVAALAATRNAVWFELAFAVVLPRLLDAVRPAVPPVGGVKRLNLVLGPAALAAAAVVLGTHLAKPLDWFDRAGNANAAAAVSAAAGPRGYVLADDRHADWLLWRRPELAGRVAYDVRFELFDAKQLRTLVALEHRAPTAWRRCGRGFAVVTFDRPDGVRAVLRQPRLVLRTKAFGAYAQETVGVPCRL